MSAIKEKKIMAICHGVMDSYNNAHWCDEE